MKTTIATRIVTAALPLAVATTLIAIPGQAQALTPNQTTPTGVVQTLNYNINYFWWWTFRQAGWSYSAPTQYVWYNGAGLPSSVSMGSCGMTESENSYYCSSTRAIYLDRTWNQSLINTYGDFGQAFVLIHEWAHHIQTVRPGNWMDWASRNRYFAGRELQADCLSGIYVRYLATTGLMASGDLNEALAWLDRHGDAAGTSWYAPNSHGTPAQRRAWFLYGYNTYSIGACDQVYDILY